MCGNWMHFACEDINRDESREWQNVPLGYICTDCRTDETDAFDYKMGLHRLNEVK